MKQKRAFFFISFFLYQIGIIWMLYFTKYAPDNPLINYSFFIMSAVITLLAASFLILVREIIKNVKLETEISVLKQQQELQKRQRQSIQKKEMESLQFHKDVIHQLSHLQDSLEKDDPEEAKKYFTRIARDFQSVRFRPCCSDSLISAVLDSKREFAKEHLIQVDYQIFLPENLEDFSSSLNAIFFNLLDNAIESCLRLSRPGSFIRVSSKKHQNFFMIHMINSKSDSEKFSRHTTKGDSFSHGFGLSIIEEIVQNYDGSCEWKDQGDTFDSLIMLKLPE